MEVARWFEKTIALDPDCLVRILKSVLLSDGDRLAISTGEKPVWFLDNGQSDQRAGSPVSAFVMKAREELKLAFEEYESGNFFKKRSP